MYTQQSQRGLRGVSNSGTLPVQASDVWHALLVDGRCGGDGASPQHGALVIVATHCCSKDGRYLIKHTNMKGGLHARHARALQPVFVWEHDQPTTCQWNTTHDIRTWRRRTHNTHTNLCHMQALVISQPGHTTCRMRESRQHTYTLPQQAHRLLTSAAPFGTNSLGHRTHSRFGCAAAGLKAQSVHIQRRPRTQQAASTSNILRINSPIHCTDCLFISSRVNRQNKPPQQMNAPPNARVQTMLTTRAHQQPDGVVRTSPHDHHHHKPAAKTHQSDSCNVRKRQRRVGRVPGCMCVSNPPSSTALVQHAERVPRLGPVYSRSGKETSRKHTPRTTSSKCFALHNTQHTLVLR